MSRFITHPSGKTWLVLDRLYLHRVVRSYRVRRRRDPREDAEAKAAELNRRHMMEGCAA